MKLTNRFYTELFIILIACIPYVWSVTNEDVLHLIKIQSAVQNQQAKLGLISTCGPNAINALLHENNFDKDNKSKVNDMMNWISEYIKSGKLEQEESFCKTFPELELAKKKFNYIDNVVIEDDYLLSYIATTPDAIIDYTFFATQGKIKLIPTQISEDFSINNLEKYNNVILGLSSKTRETSGQPYSGLAHWVYITKNQTVIIDSNMSQEKVAQYFVNNKNTYNKIVFILRPS